MPVYTVSGNPLAFVTTQYGYVVQSISQTFVDRSLFDLGPFEVGRAVSRKICEVVLDVLVDCGFQYAPFVTAIQHEFDMRRALDQSPHEDADLLGISAASKGYRGVERADDPYRFQ